MLQKNLEIAAINQASAAGFKPRYLIGIVMQESSGNPNATRFEKDYKWLWDTQANKPFKELTLPTKAAKAVVPIPSDKDLVPSVSEELTVLNEPQKTSLPRGFKGIQGVTTDEEEFIGQKTSWGPMQVMGAVAREYGFKGEFRELCGISGIVYGVRHFGVLYKRFFAQHGIAGVISAYNDGDSNPSNNAYYVARVEHFAREYERSVR